MKDYFDTFNEKFIKEMQGKEINLEQLKVIFWNGAVDCTVNYIRSYGEGDARNGSIVRKEQDD